MTTAAATVSSAFDAVPVAAATTVSDFVIAPAIDNGNNTVETASSASDTVPVAVAMAVSDSDIAPVIDNGNISSIAKGVTPAAATTRKIIRNKIVHC